MQSSTKVPRIALEVMKLKLAKLKVTVEQLMKSQILTKR